jgi:hypothetical protein
MTKSAFIATLSFSSAIFSPAFSLPGVVEPILYTVPAVMTSMMGWDLCFTSKHFLLHVFGDIIAYHAVAFSPVISYFWPNGGQTAVWSVISLWGTTGLLTSVVTTRCSKLVRLVFLYGVGISYLAWRSFRRFNAHDVQEELNIPNADDVPGELNVHDAPNVPNAPNAQAILDPQNAPNV